MTSPMRVLRQIVAPTGRHRAKPVPPDETAPEQPDTTPDTTTPEGD